MLDFTKTANDELHATKEELADVKGQLAEQVQRNEQM